VLGKVASTDEGNCGRLGPVAAAIPNLWGYLVNLSDETGGVNYHDDRRYRLSTSRTQRKLDMTKPTTVLLSTEQVAELLDWARQAGQIALSHFRQVTPERKADRTFVTAADLAVEQFLAERLRAAFSQDRLIGEEGTRSQDVAASERVWAIDPIDGTTAFVQGLPGWGVSMGLLYQGQPRFGLFYIPLLDDMTYTGSDGISYWNDRPLRGSLRTDWSDKGYLAISSTAHHKYKIDIKRTRALGSAVTGFVYVARGSATATFNTQTSLWDLVAGAAILAGVGGELRYLSGRPVDYEALFDGRPTPEPVIGGHPAVLDGLVGKIEAR